jgi:O-antigen/teichoic acid export membrane protein
MYKPIVEKDERTVSALYGLFQKLYLLIGAIILVGGLALTPFLHLFAKDYIQLNVNMYTTFLMVLISVVATYLFSAKSSLMNAYKNNYITTAITQSGIVFQYILQIAVLYIIKSFEAYLFCRIIAVLAQWIVTEIITKKKYGTILKTKSKLDDETKCIVKKNIKAMFMHKIGYVLVNAVDSIVISAFVGVVSLGEYSNYTMILSSMVGIITLMFSSLTSVIGHFCVEEDKETAKCHYEAFHLLNFIIGAVFFLGYYAVVDSLIAILFSSDLIVSNGVSFVITLNGFVQFMRRSTLTFRDATGSFYGDRWKPLFEGIMNIILSILLAHVIGVTGVIVATIITNLLICHVVEPYVLYKNAFALSPQKFYLINYGMISVFLIALIAEHFVLQNLTNVFTEMLVNSLISIAFSTPLCGMILFLNKNRSKQLIKILKKH